MNTIASLAGKSTTPIDPQNRTLRWLVVLKSFTTLTDRQGEYGSVIELERKGALFAIVINPVCNLDEPELRVLDFDTEIKGIAIWTHFSLSLYLLAVSELCHFRTIPLPQSVKSL